MQQLFMSIARRARLSPAVMAAWKFAKSIPPLQRFATGLRAADDSLRVRDIDAIASLSLPANESFRRAAAKSDEVEGMFPTFSMAVVDSLLSLQKSEGVAGHMLEMGVFRGKSAALIGQHLRPRERFLLVDIEDYLDRRAIAPFADAVDLFMEGTQTLRDRYPDYGKLRGACRFIHIDASHAYHATYSEMQIADELLAPRGIIAMDDFTNLNFSQNTAAIFKYLYTAPTDLTVFLVTDQKAYLCRKADIYHYGGFILDRFLAEMASRDAITTIARTDVENEYRAFYARPRELGENGFYAPELYREKFTRP